VVLKTSLILLKRFNDVVFGIIVGLMFSIPVWFKVYQLEVAAIKQEETTHHLCKDTDTREAWLSKRNGELRCFLEHKEFPHRAKGYNIDTTSN